MMIAITMGHPPPISLLRKPVAVSAPPRPDKSADPALAVKPKAEKAASSLKPFIEVAREARAVLDAAYKRIGLPQRGLEDRLFSKAENSAIGLTKLDRRTLFAIASNEGGLFSKVESLFLLVMHDICDMKSR